MTKKIILPILLLTLVLTIETFAKPPYWEPFEITSSNGFFIAKVAKINQEDTKIKKSLFPIKCKLSVYKKNKKKLLWSCNYQYNGKRGYNLLSDDGAIFINIHPYHYKNSPIIRIYQNGELKRNIFWKELDIDNKNLILTSDGYWWLTQKPGPICFLEQTQKDLLLLKISAVNSRLTIDLNNFKIIK